MSTSRPFVGPAGTIGTNRNASAHGRRAPGLQHFLSFAAALLVPAHLSADITFQFNFTDGPIDFDLEHRTAIERAGQLWSQWLVSEAPLQFTINNRWDPALDDGAAAGAQREYNSDLDLWLTAAQAGHQAGSNRTLGNILWSTEQDWHPDFQSRPAAGHLDMLTTALHELGHLLGMVSTHRGGGQWGLPHGLIFPERKLDLFDTFLRDNQGRAPVPGNDVAFNVAPDIRFVGPNAFERHGGPVLINVPGPEAPQNIAHPFKVGGLMTYGPRMASRHGLWDYEVGMFEDLGWSFRWPQSMTARILGDAPAHNVWANGASWDWGLPPTATTNVLIDAIELGGELQSQELHVLKAQAAAHLSLWGQPGAAAGLRVRDNATLTVENVAVGRVQGAVANIILGDGQGAGTLTVDNSLIVGEFGIGSISLTNASRLVSASAVLGLNPASIGNITVHSRPNALSRFDVDGTLTIGQRGEGHVIISAGSRLTSGIAQLGLHADGQGQVSLESTPEAVSQWHVHGALTIGGDGQGHLSLTGGSRLTSLISQLGLNPGGQGHVVLRDPLTHWGVDGQLNVARHGHATLTLANAAAIDARAGLVASHAGSLGSVSLADADTRWTISGPLEVGLSGTGQVTVANQAQLQSTIGWLGTNDDGHGTVHLLGAGTQWTITDELLVGILGTGSISLHDATLNTPRAVIARSAGSHGDVSLTGSAHVNVQTTIQLGGTTGEARGSGVLDVFDNARVTAGGEVLVWRGGIIRGDGQLTASPLLLNAGAVRPGAPAGGLHLVGDYLQHRDGTLQIALSEDGHGWLTVTGHASLAGTLALQRLPSAPVPFWQPLTILAANSLDATFDHFLKPDVDNAIFDLQYHPHAVELTIGLLGDMNLDGVVASDDIAPFVLALISPLTYQAQYGIDPLIPGDTNRDGAFDTGDVAPFVQLLVGGGSQSVPEPGTLALLSGAGLMLWRRRARRQDRPRAAVSRAKRRRGALFAVVAMLGGALAPPVPAAIITVGDVNPAHDGSDPWNIIGELRVGDVNDATVIVNDGSGVTSFFGNLGNEASATGTMTVDGPGSTWINDIAFGNTEVRVGNRGTGELTISNGGAVVNDLGLIGFFPEGSGHVTASGVGSAWTNNSELRVGHGGTGTLVIQAGGTVGNTIGRIGANLGATGSVTVSGAGSSWHNSGTLLVGDHGDGTLLVSGAGTVASTFGAIGFNAAATGSVTVSGAGSVWNNSDPLRVGSSGTGTLVVEDGAAVTSRLGVVGMVLGSTGHATVTGVDSSWIMDLELEVGGMGTAGLVVADGGTVVSHFGLLGLNAPAQVEVTITGTGSAWSNSGNLEVAGFGTANLNITNGAAVHNERAFVGLFSGAVGSVTVAGAGSQWLNNAQLTIGEAGQGTLTVAGGAAVQSTNARIGAASGSSGTVTLTGSGSTWSVVDFLNVAEDGTGTLTIEDGAQVTVSNPSFASVIAFASGRAGHVTVRGPGSSWSTAGHMRVGVAGFGTLTIADGGSVSTVLADIAFSSGSSSVTLTGQDATWTVDTLLDVGGSRFGPGGTGVLTIGPGATVFVGDKLTIWDQGVVNLHGGTLRMDRYERFASDVFNLLAGTVQLAGNRNVGADPVIADLYGPAPTLAAGIGLTVEGTATLVAPVTLAGGAFTVADIQNPALLDLQRGTFRITDVDVTIGAAPFGAMLELKRDQHVIIDRQASVAANALMLISGGGSFTAQRIDNAGEIALAGATAHLIAGTLENTGLVRGQGRIEAAVDNHGELRVNAGERLVLLQGGHTSSGVINLLGDAQLDLAGSLTNEGRINLHHGNAQVHGPLVNAATGHVNIAGDSVAGFFGSMLQDGVLHVGPGARAIFYGDVAGSGAFPGPGTIEFLAGLSPGNSTARLAFAGDVILGHNTVLRMDIAGGRPGLEHDQLDVAGHIHLAGTLEIHLTDTLAAGQSIDLIVADTITGWFDHPVSSQPGVLMLGITDRAVTLIAGLLGDMNLDGVVDTGDVAPFVLGLTDPAAYEATYGIDPAWPGDVNQDGAFDTGDVAAFVQLLVGGGSQSVPEPGTLALVLLGFTLLGPPRRRTRI